MSKNKELKIRETLKSIYELYSEVDDFLFTTYNYEPDFFDEHIIAYLMGFDRKISTIGELKEADEWVRNNHISVYYDKNAMSPGTSCLTVPVFPQRIKAGVFHPKVIIIYGRLKNKDEYSAHLFVSSCNLTVSGYGRNKEAFACIEVNSKEIAESLGSFIKSLNDNEENHSNLLNFLDTINKRNSEIGFIWTNSDKGTKLIDYLVENSSGDLTVISPYFDEKGPQKILEELKNRRKTTIVPAIDGETYNIHKKNYNDLISHNVSFSELLNEDSSRFIHAKIIKYGKQIFIGSYNFTSAAFYGSNAEAALVFDNINNYDFELKDISENKLLSDTELISNRDENEINQCKIFVSVTAKWKESKLSVIVEDLDANLDYTLKLDGLSTDLINDLTESIEIEIDTEIANHILRHKIFTVYGNGNVCFKGLINELDSGDCRPELSCESLDESIMEWFEYSENNKNDKRNQLLINSDDEETEKVLKIPQKETSDIFDNYYLVAKAFENLLKQIQEARADSLKQAPTAQRRTEKYWVKYNDWEQKKKKADQNLFGFLITKPGSIENIIKFLQKDFYERKEKDIIKEWLITNYIKSAIQLFPKNLVHNDVNKLYKEKLQFLSDVLAEIDKDITNTISKVVEKKYLEWILSEFNKRPANV